MKIGRLLHEVHVRVLEFLWKLVLPRPRKRRSRWKKYLDYCLDIKPIDPYELDVIAEQRSWSHTMNKRYGPMFGEYNPYLDEETRKKLAIRPEGPLEDALNKLASLIPSKNSPTDSHDG